MGRRSNFLRIDKDAYDTPPEAVLPLLPYLHPGTRFIEPCGGKGALTAAVEAHGHQCVYTCDIAPRASGIIQRDALDLVGSDVLAADMIITNPPWARKRLHPLIDHFRQLRPTWLLFDAAWAHTQQAAPLLRFCSLFVTVGRVKWIPGTLMTGKDDAAWFRFEAFETQTVFIGKPATDRARAASQRVSAPALSLGWSADYGQA
jgi:methylase of polypeptide subunit release factors